MTRAPKACPLHALAHLIAAKPCRCPAFNRSWEGLYAIKRAGFGLCAGPGRQVGWKPQRLRSYQVFFQEKTHVNRPENPPISPIATNQKPRCIFDSVQTASRGAGNTARSGVCTLSNVLVLGCVVQCGSRIDSCETGFEGAQKDGAEGVLQLSDVMLWVLVGSTMKPRNQGWRFRGLSWWWAPLGVVKLGTNATPWS